MKTEPNHPATGLQGNIDYEFCNGLTKREYFAAHAPDHIVKQDMTVGKYREIFKGAKHEDGQISAYFAVKYADELIKALNKGK